MHLLQLKHVSFNKSLQNYSTIQIEKYIIKPSFLQRPTSRNYIHSTDDYKNIKFCNKHWTFQYPITTPYCVFFSSIHLGTFYMHDCLLYTLRHSTGTETGGSTCSIEQIQQEWTFVTLFNPDHLLGNVLRGGAYTAHSQEDVLLQEVTGQDLQTTRMLLMAANKANDAHKQKEVWK